MCLFTAQCFLSLLRLTVNLSSFCPSFSIFFFSFVLLSFFLLLLLFAPPPSPPSHPQALISKAMRKSRKAKQGKHLMIHSLPLFCLLSISERAQRTHRASPPETFHYGPKMYLRVSRTQSHLFPGQPLGCTGVTALCARVPSCVHPGAD